MENKIKNNYLLLIILILFGIILRYFVMSLGHNYDFDSYCIVGEISGNFRNVYEETTRYNYAPAFFLLQGFLYRVAQIINPDSWEIIYRYLIVTVLTFTDLGIAAFMAKRYSYLLALLFFLNPVSIIITGYHNQFDNIAVLFALLLTVFFNNDKKFNKKDILFVAFFSLSLITKHILFLFPVFILFMKNLPLKKKLLYAFVPPTIFTLSFIPFALANSSAFAGIMNNVFYYRSFNNSPLLAYFYNFLNFPAEKHFIIYMIMMIMLAWIVRKLKFENIILIYFVALVCFSSAIANQYLAIPMAAICLLNVGIWDKIYMIVAGIHLMINYDGLAIFDRMHVYFFNNVFNELNLPSGIGYILAAWILFFALIHLYRAYKKGKNMILYENCKFSDENDSKCKKQEDEKTFAQ